MYPNSTNNYGYGRSAIPSSSTKNQQHGKYTGTSATGYGAGQGSTAASSLGPSGSKARTREPPTYGTSKQTAIGDSSGAGGSGQRKSIYDRGSSGGYTPSSSTGLNNGRTLNGSSALGSSSYNQGSGSYAQTSSMLSQSLKQKSKLPDMADLDFPFLCID